jgi:tRNA G46 methylase TrmB
LTDRYERTVLDLGTGDGAAVLRLAKSEPRTLAVGVDTDASRMREISGKAARKHAVDNAVFLVGEASEALTLLQGRVDEVRITLPWGSLLRLVLDGDRKFALAVAGAL